MNLLLPQLLRQFPRKPPHCHSCWEGAGATRVTCIPGCCPIVRQLKTTAIPELGQAAPTPALPEKIHLVLVCWLFWECFKIERRWGNSWKMEFTTLASVFFKHVYSSSGSKAATVSSLKVQPGLTCWWPNTQIDSFWRWSQVLALEVKQKNKGLTSAKV